MSDKSVIIIGAGVAGLAAAYDLSRAGWEVTMLEAREQVGGRIYTMSGAGGVPIELGAEFVHGAKNDVWPLIKAAGLETHKVPDRQWQLTDGRLTEDDSFYDGLDEVLARIDRSGADRPVNEFLERQKELPFSARELARQYVQGFHAANPNLMSLHAFAEAEDAAGEMDGDRDFRIAEGYGALVEWLRSTIESNGVAIHRGTVAEVIRWAPGSVQVEAQQHGTKKTFHSVRVLVTVPVAVLKSEGPGHLRFDPELPEQMKILAGFEIGHVTKVVLRFRSRFWPVENFGFIHTHDKWLPTWWSDERGLVLTGWAGGAKGERLSEAGEEFVRRQAIVALADIFSLREQLIASELERCCFHNWSVDPFSRGAYCYIKAGMREAPRLLSQPVQETIFFAGEALASRAQQGTVHGAIESGRKAAARFSGAA
jgi:monoamine oxidase